MGALGATINFARGVRALAAGTFNFFCNAIGAGSLEGIKVAQGLSPTVNRELLCLLAKAH